MTASAFVSLKDQIPALTERQRVELSALLHRQKQQSPAWKKEMARRMGEMGSGKKFALSDILNSVAHG